MAEPPPTASNDLWTDWQQGVADARTPRQQAPIQDQGVAVTTSRSPWIHQQCPRCQHSLWIG